MKKVMGKQSMTHSEHTHSFCIFAFTPHPCKEKKCFLSVIKSFVVKFNGSWKIQKSSKGVQIGLKDCRRMLVVCKGKILDRLL